MGLKAYDNLLYLLYKMSGEGAIPRVSVPLLGLGLETLRP